MNDDFSERQRYAKTYIDIIGEVKQTNFELEDLEAAFLSGWSNAIIHQNLHEVEHLLAELKEKIKDEFSDA